MDGRTPIGARIQQLRGKLFTQQELADRAQVSVSLIRQLEQGQRHTARVDSLQRIARALDVPLPVLLEKPSAIPSTGGVVAIRQALTPVDDLLDRDIVNTAPLPLDETERTVTYLWGAYWAGRYELLSELLPNALMQARATAATVPTAERPQASHALARAYQVAGDTLVHLGQPDAAWLAIREALRAARDSGDPLLYASLRISVSWQLLVQGRYDESERVATIAAKDIEPAGAVSESQLSTYGLLTITAATSAARANRRSTVDALLDVSTEMATRIGHERSVHQTTFGPAKVAMLTVDCAVVQDDWDVALAAARALPRDADLPLAVRARHMADLALTYLRLDQDERALAVLLSMDQVAPEWIMYQTLPRQVVDELVERQRRISPPLRELAIKLGVFSR
ncbi:helix-turn-helix domain-containing protein [Actinophytocola sp.]|uniref:helix-turn-helix domain-containing protein n=1 Tax=Actinophytocola sp. TaxID=1872138 RepID=UPI003899E40A